MAATETTVTTEKRDDHVAIIRLNRPEVRNALNMEMRKALANAFTALSDDDDVRVIVLTGSGKAFAAGADLTEFVDAGAIEIMKRRTERYWAAVTATPQPIIAAIEGFALGGGLELAMACDILIAGAGAKLGQPEVRVGIMCGAGGTQRLTRAVGKYNAMRLCLTGTSIGAEEAHAMGLVSEVVENGEAFDAALAMARAIAELPPLAVIQTKEAILHGADASLDAALAMERKAMQVLFASADKDEGMRAFLEKRKAEFKGE
ncbi:MAG: enoyl-CoA hydratase-related protein [Hyphomicrobiales bacterium]|nr:enoyl-CoA hydratase-related protein [Hyphomicrobiales bacterium]